MSIRHLNAFFEPASVAVFGASERPGRVGTAVWNNLRHAGFAGTLWPVSLRHRRITGVRAWRDAASLPQAPDLAVICTPPATVPGIVRELAARGTKAAIVVTAGLDAGQRQAMLDAARPALMRIIGPNCVGVLVPGLALNASFAHTDAAPGPLAFVSQSGALVTAMLDWARGRGIGFSHFVALGDHADVDFGDMLDWLGSDPHTRAILMYVESIQSPRKFMSAARAAARNKPVIIVKAGRTAAGARAATAHTGALAASDPVFDAAIRRAGMLRVDTLQQLFIAANTLTHLRAGGGLPRGSDAEKLSRLTILTNGGGAGVMAADAASWMNVELATLSPGVRDALAALLPRHGMTANPVDIVGDAPATRYASAAQAVLADRDSGTLLMLHAPTAVVPSLEIAEALAPVLKTEPQRVLSCWLGGPSLEAARQHFRAAGLACFDTPEEAVRAFAMTVQYRRNQEQLIEAPPAHAPVPVDRDALQQLVRQALDAGRTELDDNEARGLLAACGIAVAARGRRAGSGRQATRRPRAAELVVGTHIDALFGPVLTLGLADGSSGPADERAVALPPLNAPLARELIRRSPVGRRLGERHGAAFDEAALCRVLESVSQLLAEVPEIAELAIEPLRVDAGGVVALNVRVRLDPSGPAGADHFAIRPYPDALVRTIDWRGMRLTLRPIRPEDEAQHLRFLGRLEPADIRMRIFYSRSSIERSELARLTQIDYEREMAFIAEADDDDGVPQTLGVVRAITDPDNQDAEFGIMVRSDLKRSGLGRLLMDTLIAYLKTRSTRRLVATVLHENTGMLSLAARLGFQALPGMAEDGTRAIGLPLTE